QKTRSAAPHHLSRHGRIEPATPPQRNATNSRFYLHLWSRIALAPSRRTSPPRSRTNHSPRDGLSVSWNQRCLKNLAALALPKTRRFATKLDVLRRSGTSLPKPPPPTIHFQRQK